MNNINKECMVGLNYIIKIKEYCDYIEKHLKNVQWAWEVLQDKCKDMRFIYDDFVYWDINQMVLNHDISKFSKEEFIPYCNYFYPVKNKNNVDFDKAWGHHKKLNPHHWENWAYGKSGTEVPIYNFYGDECNCVCMIIDWMAMGKEFGDTAQEYYENNKDSIKLPMWAIPFCYQIFKRIV